LPDDLAPQAAAKPINARPRDAASLILYRQGAQGLEILMGVRHARHRFMPNALVFPGGRVDPTDHRHPALTELLPETRGHLEQRATPGRARALGVAAVRELHEETNLVLGELRGGQLLPALDQLHYICRAITPPPRAIRFHARFLAAPAEAAHGTLKGSGELETLRFFPVEEALNGGHMAGITARVMGEFLRWLALPDEHRHTRELVVFQRRDTAMSDR
jgi:8-oxo-dGTP pyrophosphatase MutT (NUDIX family)